MNLLSPEKLLPEIEDILRTMPSRNTMHNDTPEVLSWLGRASAAIRMWDKIEAVEFNRHVANLHTGMGGTTYESFIGVVTMIHKVRNDLRLQTIGPVTVAVGQGGVYDYFDEIRKVIEGGKTNPVFCRSLS